MFQRKKNPGLPIPWNWPFEETNDFISCMRHWHASNRYVLRIFNNVQLEKAQTDFHCRNIYI